MLICWPAMENMPVSINGSLTKLQRCHVNNSVSQKGMRPMNRIALGLQTAWQQQSRWLRLLLPLSWLYGAVAAHQRKRLSRSAYRAPVPVMIIGNITVGGSGKTPLIITLVQQLQRQGIRVGVISRGYGGNYAESQPVMQVTAQSESAQVGDEPLLIVQATGVPLAVSARRQLAIELLLAQQPLDLILSDDGLQHYALARDIEWVVVDTVRGWGNGQLLPEGFLREPVQRLQGTTVISHPPRPGLGERYGMRLNPGQPYPLQNAGQTFDCALGYAAVAGIGFPQRFFQTLDQQQIRYQPWPFTDHHAYQSSELAAILQQMPAIITTSKDAVKILQVWQQQLDLLQRVWVLPVQAQLTCVTWQVLQQQLNALGIPFAADQVTPDAVCADVTSFG